MKQFGLTETKLFHFQWIFKKVEGLCVCGGGQVNRLRPLSVWVPTQWSSLKILAHTAVIFLHSETNMLLTISLGWQIQDVSQYWCM